MIEFEGAKELVRIVWNEAGPRRCVAATIQSKSDDSIAMDWDSDDEGVGRREKKNKNPQLPCSLWEERGNSREMIINPEGSLERG